MITGRVEEVRSLWRLLLNKVSRCIIAHTCAHRERIRMNGGRKGANGGKHVGEKRWLCLYIAVCVIAVTLSLSLVTDVRLTL